LASAQDFAQRAFLWGAGPAHDHGELQRLHDVHQEAVDELLKDVAVTRALNRILRDPLPNIYVVVECTHFSACYGINRFLALLVGRYIEQIHAGVFLFRSRVGNLRSIDSHNCSGDPDVCHGRMHEATIVGVSDCMGRSAGGLNVTVEANVLVIRHGLDISHLRFDPTPPVSRQLVPYQAPR
jgi:hypothetical protein